MPAPVVVYTAPSPSTEDVFPAPTDVFAAPALEIDHVEPALVIGYIAPAPTVTNSTPSQQFLAYTMAATTGVNLDTTSLEQIVAEQERVKQHTAEQIVHVPLPQIQEQSMEGVRVILQELSWAELVDAPVPQGLKEVVSAAVDELTAAGRRAR